MRTLIWIILFGVICCIIGYVVWNYDLQSDLEARDISYYALKDYCDMLERDNKEFLKYVPITERKKDLILLMKEMGKNNKEIWEYLWLDNSTIGKAIKKWKSNSSV